MRNRSQSAVEYAVLISIIAVALVGMGMYLRGSVNAGLKVTEEQINSTDWKMGNIQSPPGPEPGPGPEPPPEPPPY